LTNKRKCFTLEANNFKCVDWEGMWVHTHPESRRPV
jgi:hypothetical protein